MPNDWVYAVAVNGLVGPGYDTPAEAGWQVSSYREAGNTAGMIPCSLAPCLVCGAPIPNVDTEQYRVAAEWHDEGCPCARDWFTPPAYVAA